MGTADERESNLSFQAYLDKAEEKTGLTPQQIVDRDTGRGYGPGTKAGEVLTWLAEDFDLGRGHGMALVHVITKGPQIDDKHVGSSGTHRDESDVLRLDGIAARTSVT